MQEDASNDELTELADRYWSHLLRSQPTVATFLGVHDHDDRLPDLSAEADAAHRAVLSGLRSELDVLRRGTLGERDRVTAALLEHQLGSELAAIDLRMIELASDHMVGPHAELLMMAPQLTYPAAEHADAALTRYSRVPLMMEQALERFRAGLRSGRTPSAAVISRTLHTLDAYLASDVHADPFLAPQLPADWAGAALWRDRALGLVRSHLRPAFEQYRTVIAQELAPVARDDEHPGWCWLPDGEELYAALVARHTTLTLAPRDLHELGRHRCEVDLPVEFAEIGAEALGTDDLPEIFHQLRSDPGLRHRDAEEVVAIARDSVERATAAMGAWFGRLPTVACRVEPIPTYLADDAPYAYYFPPSPDGSRAGTYFINTSDPTGSSRTEAQSIAFHEAIPGHHLQISISQELEGVPEFQRHDGATSYIEGWGLYAERLADEMGLYSGPLDRLGMLTADAWRSARLVVDTGLHSLGWTREQALDYFTGATPVPVDQIAAEVDRYLAMPGQALAYTVGQIEIQRLRSDAAQRLGSRFDLPGFHDTVLGSGAVTLPVLGDLVEAWVNSADPAAP